ncbi:MAG: 16S rRNA (adenine(1518)-N(6)/adenine(1519)-N(6))-dimethyltransferase RsmA [Methylohalobius sp.]|nr:16S rRNA (adenine(1518)-N(6)/adenine(1519)-N(6))-dimethyltransferase RsmA [Methylohalobius sp.]
MLKPKKRFGQHFLVDARVLVRILAALTIQSDDHVVEIGPGKGALTRYLLPHCRRLDAIEIDRDLVELLKEKFAGQEKLHLHCADVLRFDFASLAEPEKRLKIVGNLPYNISTPLLFHLFKQKYVIADMVFMLQKEVATRLTASPGSKRYGRLSVMAQYHCGIEMLFTVPAQSFRPPPKVTSAVVRLTPHPALPVEVSDYTRFQAVVAAAFSQRRKTLRNALYPLLSAEAIRACGIDPGSRAEELPLSAFAALSRALGPVHPTIA